MGSTSLAQGDEVARHGPRLDVTVTLSEGDGATESKGDKDPRILLCFWSCQRYGNEKMTTSRSELPSWKALAQHHASIATLHMRDLFAADPQRFDRFSLQWGDMLVDYSKHRVTPETVSLALAREVKIEQWRDRMFAGEKN